MSRDKDKASAISGGSLRRWILASVGTLVLLSLFGSVLSLYRITEVNRTLDAINRIAVPLSKLLVQVQSDADIYRRELDLRLGNPHWNDPHWRPRPIPKWIENVLDNELERSRELLNKDLPWASPESRERWRSWAMELSQGFDALKADAAKLFSLLEQNNRASADELYSRWMGSLDNWIRQVQWGTTEYDRSLKQDFNTAEATVSDLRTGLEIILIVVVSLSLLLLWLGERALRPLGELTVLAREITRRGLRKEDKSLLPEVPVTRNDEVSQLAREFHRMATALLEREKTVEAQKQRLQDQNKLLHEMGELNESVLNSIDSILLVTDLQGRITQCNPVAAKWLGMSPEKVQERLIGTELLSWPKMRSLMPAFPGRELWLSRVKDSNEAWRINPIEVEGRTIGGHLMPLHEAGQRTNGTVIVLEDLTEEVDLQKRLRSAEKLAAIGRMSAQVAHEVRNPLHSIGLEAEMAADMAAKLEDSALKQSLQSILSAVDRLDKITANYLKLSRLSAGEKKRVDMGEVLESVLATYASACQAQGILVDWSRAPDASFQVWGDADLLENVLGNLFRNAMQALQGQSGNHRKRIFWGLECVDGQVVARITDNGPGILPEIRDKLFAPFVTTRADGTGLGLSFAKKVVEDHGGTLRCLNLADSGMPGACFELRIPLHQRGALDVAMPPLKPPVFSPERGKELNV